MLLRISEDGLDLRTENSEGIVEEAPVGEEDGDDSDME